MKEETTRQYLKDLTEDNNGLLNTILDLCEERSENGDNFINVAIPITSKNEHVEVIEKLITDHKLTVEVTALLNYQCFMEISWN